jgi:RND family efflux transporter MFP subunit
MNADDRLEQLRIDRDDEPAGPSAARRVAVVLGAVALLAVATAWWLGRVRAPPVETATVRAAGPDGSLSVLDASGYVVARRQATVSSKITGRIVEVRVEEGQAVGEGDVLARLDDAVASRELALSRAELAAAGSALKEIEVRLREARLELERARDLRQAGVASQSALDMAEAEADSLAARLDSARDEVAVSGRRVELAEQAVEDTFIRAPFDGVAVSKDAQPGEMISPVSAGGGFTRTGVSTIVDMGSLEIEVDVNEAFIQRVEPGQEVLATLDAYPDWRIPARVITTVPAADRQKATFKVRIAFQELGDPRILPDMGVKVAFQAEVDEAEAASGASLLVPRAAIRREGDVTVVFVVRDGAIERRAVTEGRATGGDVEVRAGLREGEVVVVSPPEQLKDGDRVETG